MKITEIRVKLMSAPEDTGDKLKAFCSVTFNNEIVIRDLKIIEGSKGLFVAMPSRKLMARCPKCHTKNPVRARFCNDCGTKQRRREEATDEPGAGRRLYADVAHPIHAVARDRLQRAVIAAFEREVRESKREGYVPPRFEDLDYDDSLELRPPRREVGQERSEGA